MTRTYKFADSRQIRLLATLGRLQILDFRYQMNMFGTYDVTFTGKQYES
jgi:hypothetical protein